MNVFSLKHFIASTVLAGTLASQSAFGVLINTPAEVTGTEGISVSFGSTSVGVGYIQRWTERVCKKILFIKKCKTEHYSADRIQSTSSRYYWDFGDGNSTSGVVSTSVGYYADGNDNLLVNIPIRSNVYLAPGIYNASLTVTKSTGEESTRGVVVMVKPSNIVSTNTDVCDPNNATIVSDKTSFPWGNRVTWSPQRVPTVDDIVLIKAGHTIRLPRGKAQIRVAGLCVEGTVEAQRNNNSTASPNHVVFTASAIHNKGTIRSTNGVNGSITDGAYKNATSGGSITLFAGRFKNEGTIDATGRGGDDSPYLYFPSLSGQMDAFGGDGGHVGIFANKFTNTGTLLAGSAGHATLFENWANYIYGNAYGGRGGSIHISTQSTQLSSSFATLKSGCGGNAEALGSWLQEVKMKGGNWFASSSFTGTYTGRLYEVAGGRGGSIDIHLSHLGGSIPGCNGQTIAHVTQDIRFDPTVLTVDETTRLTNANNIYIYAGDDAEVDLRKLVPNAVKAYKTVTLSVGGNGTIDLRGVSDKVFQAGEKVNVYADNILLDNGVTLEDLVDAPELNVSASKILRFVDVDYSSQVKGTPGTIFPVPLTLFNNGPTTDTYTVEATDSQGWLVAPYPTEVRVNGLRRSNLYINVKLPTSGDEYTNLAVQIRSISDPSVGKYMIIRVSPHNPEVVNSRDGRQADVSIVLDAGYRMGDKLHDIADTLEKLLGDRAPLSPSDAKVEAWLSQFDDSNPPTREEYLEFIEYFQPINPPPPPVIELITFTDTAMTRVVTDNMGDVIGRIRGLQTSEDATCTLASVDAVEYAATNLKEKGHLFLATASTPGKDMSSAIQQLQQKRVKAHVLLAENCDGSAATEAAYQELSGKTGGIFRISTDDTASDMLALEGLLDMILSMGKYTVMGTITDEAGQPLAGVEIEINELTTTTDSAGNWEIPNFMEGEYTLTASKEGYVFLPQVVEVGNEIYYHQVEIMPVSSLAMSAISDTRGDVRQGEDVTYTFIIVNGGSQTATGVTFIDVLPAGTTATALEALFAGTCDVNTLTCQFPDLTPGASVSVELTIHNEGADNLKNVATLSSNEYPDDIQTSRKVVKPYFSVDITDTPDPIVMESVLHYRAIVELSDLAPKATANDVKLFLRLPEGTELSSINTDHGVCDISDYPKVACELDDLSIAAPGDISQMTVDVDVQLTDATLLLLTSEASVSASNYPTHTIKEQTKVVVPPEAMAHISIVMDTTHSMHEEVNGTLKALEAFIEQQINAKTNPVVNLIEFKDNVTLRAFTSNLQQIIDTIHQFEVKDGGLCQEASAEALNLAVDHTVPGGTIVFVTDAAPYENADLESLGNRLKAKKIKLTVLISGDCTTSSGKQSWNDIQ